MYKLQSTECTRIKDEAIDSFDDRISVIMNWTGALLFLLVVTTAVEMFVSVKLVAVPIIMLSLQSMASNILILPAAVSILGLLPRVLFSP